MNEPVKPALVENMLLLRKEVAAQGQRSGVRWADALSTSVRPVITYWFMALYCAAKTAAFVGAMAGGAGWGAAILHSWTEAEGYLAAGLMTALNATLRYCPGLATEPEGRLAAVMDFTFNLGAGRLQTSTLRRRINQRDWPTSERELSRWIYGGGKVLPGLVVRRKVEAALMSDLCY